MRLDELDWRLLSLIYHDPYLCQTELAEELEITQPAVCMRIKKLKEKGVLKTVRGLDLGKVDVKLSSVFGRGDLSTLKASPYFVMGFVAGGRIHAIFMGENEETALSVPRALMHEIDFLTTIDHHSGLPVAIGSGTRCAMPCPECEFYGDCKGLPGTEWYRGKVFSHMSKKDL